MTRRNFICTRHTLRPGSRDAVRAWAKMMNSRSGDVSQTLRDEGVRMEMVFLEESDEGDSLLFLLDTDDYDRAVEIFMQSDHEVDKYHLEFLTQNSVARKRLTLISCHEDDG